jgi:hypothetical protein
MSRIAIYGAVSWLAAALTGCGAIAVQPVKVPVPVECRTETPARPVMPTERLAPGIDPDRFAAAAMAEIELREGYEEELRAALTECVKPLCGSFTAPFERREL